MSMTGKGKVSISKKKSDNNINILNEKVRKLIFKVDQLEKVKQISQSPQQFSQSPQQFSQFERIFEKLQNKINRLEQKNNQLENSIKKIKPTGNSSEVKILNNIINNDLNKMKIKIEKNESIIKKILFN